MSGFNNAGKPIPMNESQSKSGYWEYIVNGEKVGLKIPPNARYAIAQIQTVDSFIDALKVVRYVSNGDNPTVSKGFLGGANDKIIFEKSELNAGIYFISAEELKTSKVVVQFYEH